jgi:hypothetical protein
VEEIPEQVEESPEQVANSLKEWLRSVVVQPLSKVAGGLALLA